MLKALLFTLTCGLAATKLPLWITYPALYVIPALEVIYMTVHHQDFAIHRLSIGYFSLLFVGLAGFYAATFFLIRAPSDAAPRR